MLSLKRAEEWLVEDSKILKRQPHLIIIVPVIIIIVCALFYVVFFYEASVEKVTAIEGKEVADEAALGHYDSAILVSISTEGVRWPDYINITEDGRSTDWYYYYITSEIYGGNATSFCIHFDEGEYKMSYTGGPLVSTSNLTDFISANHLRNWSIDSSDAIQIAKSNTTFSNWLSANTGASLSIMGLEYDQDVKNACWLIEYSDGTYDAVIYIDAQTGAVIDVEV